MSESSRCVEVSNNPINMRCSPVLLAVLTASAAFSFTRPAQAQVAAPDPQTTRDWVATSSNSSTLELGTDLSVLPLPVKGRVASEFVQPEFSPLVANARLAIAPDPDRQNIAQQNITQNIAPNVAQAAPFSQAPLNPTAGDQAPIPEPPASPAELPTQPTDPVVPAPAPSGVQVPVVPAPAAPIPPAAPGTPVSPLPGTPVAPQAPASPLPPGTSPPGTTPPPTTAAPTAPEPRVLVAEVSVEGAEGDLQNTVYQAIRTIAGRTTTRSQLQEDINAIFATGFFSNVRVAPEDTPLGVRVTFTVQPNPALRNVRLQGSKVETLTYKGEAVPTQTAIDGIFGPQYGRIINLNEFQAGVAELNKLYQDNGYVLAQVIDAPQVAPNGRVTLTVAEGEIEAIQLRFLNRDGDATDAEGKPIKGRTRDFIITREFESKPGDVFNRDRIQTDLQRAFALGIFEDLSLSLKP